MQCHAMPCHAMPCRAIVCVEAPGLPDHAWSGIALPGQVFVAGGVPVMSCHAIPGFS